MLGVLNLLLSWHGAYDPTAMPIILIVIGVLMWTASRVASPKNNAEDEEITECSG